VRGFSTINVDGYKPLLQPEAAVTGTDVHKRYSDLA